MAFPILFNKNGIVRSAQNERQANKLKSLGYKEYNKKAAQTPKNPLG